MHGGLVIHFSMDHKQARVSEIEQTCAAVIQYSSPATDKLLFPALTLMIDNF